MGDYETKQIFAKKLSRLLSDRGITQAELAGIMGVAASSVSAWCNGEKMPRMDKVEWIARYFNVMKTELLEDVSLPKNISLIHEMKKVPLIGNIACGTPILAEENITDYIDLPGHIRADYALTCRGDSMINAGIRDGDIVYIRKQEAVENGQIAAVLVGDDEATLKRFYLMDGKVTLNAENPAYPPMVYVGDEIRAVHVIGLAIAFTHVIN